MPARSLHSYTDTLIAVLKEFNPDTVFEWGPGVSTQVIAMHDSVKKLVSVEHDPNFYERMRSLKFKNLQVHLCEDMNEYVSKIGEERYDLIFIDGRNRAKCLDKALGLGWFTILHDAARSDYRHEVYQFPYQIWTDDGNTVFLTKYSDIYEKAKECLGNLICKAPKPELVVMVGHSAEKGEIF